MPYSPSMAPAEIAILLAAAFGAGVMNAIAGGGTILTFPVLLFLGQPAITANATSTVALWPGAVASLFAYRREVATHRAWFRTLFLPSLVGGALGSWLLLRTPEKLFANLAPLLVLFATVLFMVQGVVARGRARGGAAGDTTAVAPLPTGGRQAAALLAQLLVAVYGGYFGAGIGILMLALLGFLGLRDIHAMNGLKNFFGLCINGVAAGYFLLRGAADLPSAAVIFLGAVLGGYGGARLARRIGRDKARAAVVAIGLLVTALLAWQRWGA
jgi:uncharacterized membrane protein YfcA